MKEAPSCWSSVRLIVSRNQSFSKDSVMACHTRPFKEKRGNAITHPPFKIKNVELFLHHYSCLHPDYTGFHTLKTSCSGKKKRGSFMDKIVPG